MAYVPLFLDLFSNTFFFLTTIVVAISAIGLFCKCFSVILVNAFLAFTTLALETNYGLYETILYIVLAVCCIAGAFQIWTEILGGNDGGDV